MDISVDEIRGIARLARLELSAEEEATFSRQVSRILDYIERIGEVEAETSELAEELAGALPVEALDVAAPGLSVDVFLANAPEALDHFLLVPKVKKGDGG
jgi:aspartyl-tRNA(Asn)/glutamyl-tRNA(Gln) amidotransferase subunit C